MYSYETLVAELQKQGINYLSPSDAKGSETINSNEDLLLAIINQTESRLKLALVILFIRQNNFTPSVVELVKKLPASQALELQILYMAAAYLQRLWWTSLGFYLDNLTHLPDLYSQSLQLPSTEERFGKVGLAMLAEKWSAQSNYLFNRLASLNKTMDLFFEQLKLEQQRYEHLPHANG